MAISARVTPPSYQMYDPSDLEKVFAQAMFADKGLGGTAYAMLQVAGRSRQEDIAQYRCDLDRANQLQGALIQQEMAADMAKEALAKGPDWMAQGADIQNIPVVANLFKGGTIDPQTALMIKLAAQKR